jgi:hypothetical protein
MCDLALTGTDGNLTLLLVGVAVLLVAVGAVLVLRGRLRGGRAKGAALAVLLLVGGIGLGTISAPAPAQAADCSSSSGSSSGDGSGGGDAPDTAVLSVTPGSWTDAVTGVQEFTVTNTSTTVTALDTVVSITGDPHFVILSTTCTSSLAPGASCVVVVGFASASGDPSATLDIAGSNTNDLAVPLSGIDATTLSISSTRSVIFEVGPHPVFTITNTGTVDAVDFEATITMNPSASDVQIVTNTCASITTLAAGDSCSIEFEQTGPDGANATIEGSASNVATPVTASLTGLSS